VSKEFFLIREHESMRVDWDMLSGENNKTFTQRSVIRYAQICPIRKPLPIASLLGLRNAAIQTTDPM
jgi:hypothetical protein